MKKGDIDFSSLGCIGVILFVGLLAEVFPWNNGLWPFGLPFLIGFLIYVYMGFGLARAEGGIKGVGSFFIAIYCGLGLLGFALFFFGVLD